MTAITASENRLPITLLVLRVLIFGVFVFWACDKLFAPAQAAQIYEAYFSLAVGRALVITIGALELVLLAAFLIGYRKQLTRALMLVLMAIAVVAPGRFYLTPFEDHILLYFAAWPMLAVTFMLYYLRDRDTLATLPAPPREAHAAVSAGTDADPRLPLCLMLIRVAVFADLIMWNMDKFFQPLQTSRIFRGFYAVGGGLPYTSQLSYAAVYLMGALQLALLVAFLLGYKKRLSYGLVFALHTVSTLAPWGRYLEPLTSHTLLFLAAFPMLGGIGALYYLREHDRLCTVGGRRALPAATMPRTPGAWMPLGLWSRPARLALAGVIVASIYLLTVTAQQWSVEHREGPQLVSELEARTQAEPALSKLTPQWDTQEWTASYHSANCTFDHPEIADCWEIHFVVWVPGLPGQNVMAGKRQVEAGWIVNAATHEVIPDRNARNYFALASNSAHVGHRGG